MFITLQLSLGEYQDYLQFKAQGEKDVAAVSTETIADALMLAKKNYALDQVPADLDSKDQVLYMCIAEIANDINSSSFRELMTCEIAGYENLPGKLGKDATNGDRLVEIKPQNKYRNSKRKLNGSGNFTDFTHAREAKESADNVQMCISGFSNGKLVYIFEFDYNSPSFRKRIQEVVQKAHDNGQKYCRSASFGWNHWKDSPSLRLVWSSPNLDTFRSDMCDDFYKFIKSDLLHEEIPLTAKQIAAAEKKAAKEAEKAAKKAKREADRAAKKAAKAVEKEKEKQERTAARALKKAKK